MATPSNNDPDIDAYLAQLTPSERSEARAAAEAAKRAEERAEQRELERAIQEKEDRRRRERQQEEEEDDRIRIRGNTIDNRSDASRGSASGQQRLVYVPKRKREQLQNADATIGDSTDGGTHVYSSGGIGKKDIVPTSHSLTSNTGANRNDAFEPMLTTKERLAVVKTYLGATSAATETTLPVVDDPRQQKKKQLRTNKKATFKFRWDETDDTSNFDDPDDLIYAPLHSAPSNNNNNSYAANSRRGQQPMVNRQRHSMNSIMGGEVSSMVTVMEKPIDQMTPRDWRILRENYEITVRGGQAPPPMRRFTESPAPSYLPQLHPALLDAIHNVLRFKEPSPIQRQAIPIGLQRRDLIGISETGSGKTVAFGVPMCHYLLHLPTSVLQSVADQGPLAIVMAPTRELAIQIEVELSKLLSRQRFIQSTVVVGGQPIQQQAQTIRRGIHIIVGTPGRINDCIEMAYLVLNQCCYIVMDEADRMIDMGFAPQMESILDSMGGALKSENEKETYQQEMEDLKTMGVARHRVTVMFSATMPLEMERIAKRYLRHPSIISIGDKDSSKNSRIIQKLVWLPNPAKKEEALRSLLRDPKFLREKVIVFVNEKKHADSVGRMVERSGRQCVVLHGGKSQDQREENLETFRKGGIVMVATDVAGRGLDIPDVAHVINYDLPTRSIENYTHRIGRTGRAGKEGLATSLITDEDEGIMAALRAYLESTGNQVPERLARHSAAASTSASGDVMY